MNFSFISPVKIVVGAGEALNLTQHLPNGIDTVLLLHGASLAKKAMFNDICRAFTWVNLTTYQCTSGEPSPQSVDTAVTFAKNKAPQAVIGIGGGSVMDTAKAVAALVTNKGRVTDYLEGVGIGKKVVNPPLFFIAVPTTSGTGTEVTKNAVVSSKAHGFKKSMRDDKMIADVTVLDANLTANMPKAIIASSGMDAICQLIESYTTKNTNTITDALALYHATLAVDAIEKMYETDDAEARQTMSVCAMISGLTLANAGLGIAHGIAAGLGATTLIPHGVACGLLLPISMRFNISKGATKYTKLGEAFAGKSFATTVQACDYAIARIEQLNQKLNIPKDLKAYGLTTDDIKKAAAASMGSSMSKNPVPVTEADCVDILSKLI